MPSKKKQHGCVPSALGPSRISMSALSDNGGPIPPAVFSMNHSCEVPKASGIYAIVNCVNGKRYVGSAVNFRRRLYGHRSHLRRGTHHNHHLQTAWVKYGHDAFVFFILEYVEIPMLLKVEQRYLDANRNGYNTAKCAEAPTLGFKHSPETIAKLKLKRKGPGSRATYSEEWCRHISEAKRGKPTWSKGKTFSVEVRAKMSAAHTGKRFPNRKLPPMSQATRNKINKARWAACVERICSEPETYVNL